MTRITVRRHLIQIKFGAPTLQERIRERSYYAPVQAEPPLKLISIVIGVFAVLTCPLWLGAAFWSGVAGTFWLIQNMPWVAGLLGAALVLFVLHGVAWESSAYRYWFYRQEFRVEALLERLGLRKPKKEEV